MNSKIYLYDYFVVIVSDSLDVLSHKHAANQVTFSLENKNLILVDGRGRRENLFFMIPALEEHRFENRNLNNLTILIDYEGQVPKEEFLEKAYSMIIENIDHLSEPILQDALSCLEIFSKTEKDERIKESIEYINAADSFEGLKAKYLAERVNLSEGRFLHLFKLEMGIPLRKYLLWRKLKLAAQSLCTGNDFTTAAFEAGFSDLPHLSKFFKETFGITMKDLFSNSRFIQS